MADPTVAQLFFKPGGLAYAPGDRLRQPLLAATLGPHSPRRGRGFSSTPGPRRRTKLVA